MSLREFLTTLVVAGSLSSASAATFPAAGTGEGLAVRASASEARSREHPGETELLPPSVGTGGGIAYVPVFDIPTVFFVQAEARAIMTVMGALPAKR